MTNHLKRIVLIGLLLLIVLTNAWVLVSVSLNKSEVLSVIRLTERELTILQQANKENSGLSLRINYRVISERNKGASRYHYHGNTPVWLDTAKMKSLGFTEKELDARLKNSTSTTKEVYVALELNGESYQRTLADTERWYDIEIQKEGYAAENAKKGLEREKARASRLFVIDAAIDIEELYSRYHSQSNVFVAAAQVQTSYDFGEKSERHKRGRISDLSVPQLYVPYPLNQKLQSLPYRAYDDYRPPRFEVEVSYGASLLPWISELLLYEEN